MCRQAVHRSVHGFGSWLLKLLDRDEYPPSGATVFVFSVELCFVQGHLDSDCDFMCG